VSIKPVRRPEAFDRLGGMKTARDPDIRIDRRIAAASAE